MHKIIAKYALERRKRYAEYKHFSSSISFYIESGTIRINLFSSIFNDVSKSIVKSDQKKSTSTDSFKVIMKHYKVTQKQNLQNVLEICISNYCMYKVIYIQF